MNVGRFRCGCPFLLLPPSFFSEVLVEWERESATAGGYALCITRGGPGILTVGVA